MHLGARYAELREKYTEIRIVAVERSDSESYTAFTGAFFNKDRMYMYCDADFQQCMLAVYDGSEYALFRSSSNSTDIQAFVSECHANKLTMVAAQTDGSHVRIQIGGKSILINTTPTFDMVHT
jgi:hypothetical protein